MKFAVMMHTNPTHSKALSEDEVSSIEAKHAKLLEELEATGELINGAGLHLPEETTTIRIAAGKPVSSTGPVAVDGGRVAEITSFVFPGLFPAFGLPPTLR